MFLFRRKQSVSNRVSRIGKVWESLSIIRIGIVASFALVVCSEFALAQQPFGQSSARDESASSYAFNPSKNGQNFKRFQHSIFGVSIDIPAGWTFGIHGAPPSAVIVLYPESVSVSSFSPQFEMIELGLLPANITNMSEAQELVLSGMKVKHQSFVMIERPANVVIGGNPAVQWVFQWQSKSNYTIIEYVTLVRDKYRIRTIAVRTARPDFSAKKNLYDNIISTVSFDQPKI